MFSTSNDAQIVFTPTTSSALPQICLPKDKTYVLTAVGLPADARITVARLNIQRTDNTARLKNGEPCASPVGGADKVIGRSPYMIGECAATACADSPNIVIEGGFCYEFTYTGTAGGYAEIYSTETPPMVKDCGCFPCVDTSWAFTGGLRCTIDKNSVEREEISNCKTTRWVVDHAAEWTDSGEHRCAGENVESKWTSECGGVEWRVLRPVVWVDTIETRCFEHIVQKKQINDCGKFRWSDTTGVCGYSPSVPMIVSDGCGGCGDSVLGFMFHPDEPRDPVATVAIDDCDGIVYGYIYPSAGAGHTIKMDTCDGNISGYFANKSTTAPEIVDCGCASTASVNNIVINVPPQQANIENNVIVPAPPSSEVSTVPAPPSSEVSTVPAPPSSEVSTEWKDPFFDPF